MNLSLFEHDVILSSYVVAETAHFRLYKSELEENQFYKVLESHDPCRKPSQYERVAKYEHLLNYACQLCNLPPLIAFPLHKKKNYLRGFRLDPNAYSISIGCLWFRDVCSFRYKKPRSYYEHLFDNLMRIGGDYNTAKRNTEYVFMDNYLVRLPSVFPFDARLEYPNDKSSFDLLPVPDPRDSVFLVNNLTGDVQVLLTGSLITTPPLSTLEPRPGTLEARDFIKKLMPDPPAQK